jgi:hypothetical protein
MKTEIGRVLALFGGAAAVVLAFGFNGGGYDTLSITPRTATSSFGVTAAPTPLAPPAGLADGRAAASPSGCIVGLNCGPIGPIGPKRPKRPRPSTSQTLPPALDRWDKRVLPTVRGDGVALGVIEAVNAEVGKRLPGLGSPRS